MNESRAAKFQIGKHQVSVVVREGSGDGVPLLLCSGIGAHHEALKPFA